MSKKSKTNKSTIKRLSEALKKKPEGPSPSFCEECCKIVPESERVFSFGRWAHQYKREENYYNNAGTGRIGYYPVQRTYYCGTLREPNEQEYFIYHTLKC